MSTDSKVVYFVDFVRDVCIAVRGDGFESKAAIRADHIVTTPRGWELYSSSAGTGVFIQMGKMDIKYDGRDVSVRFCESGSFVDTVIPRHNVASIGLVEIPF